VSGLLQNINDIPLLIIIAGRHLRKWLHLERGRRKTRQNKIKYPKFISCSGKALKSAVNYSVVFLQTDLSYFKMIPFR
jgi:hypothetical protein